MPDTSQFANIGWGKTNQTKINVWPLLCRHVLPTLAGLSRAVKVQLPRVHVHDSPIVPLLFLMKFYAEHHRPLYLLHCKLLIFAFSHLAAHKFIIMA